MLAVETTLEPTELLARLQGIEDAAGRTRSTRWASRTLDLDIVLFDDRDMNESGLVIPHPGLADRPFWQREVGELRHALDHPIARRHE
jgi:2-amino-4-hydroxy-6-hydroxymethyldihydropteridine diphosphokinase